MGPVTYPRPHVRTELPTYAGRPQNQLIRATRFSDAADVGSRPRTGRFGPGIGVSRNNSVLVHVYDRPI